MDIRKYIVNKKKIVDKALNRYLPSSGTKPAVIHKAMRYAVFPGGKRIRPILAISAFEACDGKGRAIMPVACAIELIHSYTLIHDDLPCMDNDDSRRGRPSCHKKFNEAIALLAGDALLTLGFQLLSDTGNTDIIKEISRAVGSCGTIGGQVVDIEAKGELDYIMAKKTGALFEAAVRSAGILKGSDKKKIEALGNFGRYFGLTFQLVDDLIDNDGYVKVYESERVKKMAELFAKRAKSHLDIFGRKSRRLSEISDFILKRRS